MDRVDWRSEWSPMDGVTYLNFAAHAAIPRAALDAIQASLRAKTHPHVVDDQMFFRLAIDLRQSLAALIGANAGEIALTNSAGAGAAMLSYALRWSPGDEVILTRGEFPMHYTTWKPMEAREGIRLRIVAPQGRFICADDLIRALTPKTRLISVSHVRFDDGSKLDVPRLAAACKKNGTLVLLDVSQTCGTVPIDVRQIGADFIVCAGYKYLLSPWGTGFLWVSADHMRDFRPGPYNWLSQGVSTFASLNYVDPVPAATMSRWDSAEASSLYNFNLTVMEASVRFVLKAGVERIHAHNQGLIDYFFAHLPEGCRAASPMHPSQRGGFGCIDAATPEATQMLFQVLHREKFVVALREGRIRVAPHLISSQTDVDRMLDVINQTIRQQGNVIH